MDFPIESDDDGDMAVGEYSNASINDSVSNSTASSSENEESEQDEESDSDEEHIDDDIDGTLAESKRRCHDSSDDEEKGLSSSELKRKKTKRTEYDGDSNESHKKIQKRDLECLPLSYRKILDTHFNELNELKTIAEHILKFGYFIFRNVLPSEEVNLLLNGQDENQSLLSSQSESSAAIDMAVADGGDVIDGLQSSVASASASVAVSSSFSIFSMQTKTGFRRRSDTQTWRGAKKSILSRIKQNGSAEIISAPLTSRSHGRYDMPLPKEAQNVVMKYLEDRQILTLIQKLCPRGSFRTQDIMLSRPGSQRQPIHTDSSWKGRAKRDPKPHYFTILIPLTEQTAETGGTRIWPGSHRFPEVLDSEAFIDTVSPLLNVGDVLVFDGLLAHYGMENRSKYSDRYFYYAAFSTVKDPNTDVTGY